MIESVDLKKSFGDKVVYDGANFKIEDGSICGLVGINGAGKSTLLRILSGVLRADAGSIFIDDERVFNNEVVKRDIFFLSDDPYFDANVTGRKIGKLYSAFYPFDEGVFKRYTDLFKLNIDKPIRNFSKGMKRQIFISAALACRPKYLFLDEAFDGLDPLARLEFKRGIIELQEAGSTVIIASHSLRELEDICDSFILIDEARVKSFGKLLAALENIFKLQLAFKGEVEEGDLPFKCLNFTKVGRVITVVARGNKEEALESLAALSPIIVEEIPMDFEDMFIEEVQSRGYLK